VGLSCALVLVGTCFGSKLLEWASRIV
jgi:hypothetical protein